jgi:hypothetical protein
MTRVTLWDFAVSLDGEMEPLVKASRLLDFLILEDFQLAWMEGDFGRTLIKMLSEDPAFLHDLGEGSAKSKAVAERVTASESVLREFIQARGFDCNWKGGSQWGPDQSQKAKWFDNLLSEDFSPPPDHQIPKWYEKLQEPVQLLVQELEELNCMYTANFFQFLSGHHMEIIEHELSRMPDKLFQSRKENTGKKFIDFEQADFELVVIDFMSEHVAKLAKDLLSAILLSRWINWRHAQLDALRNGRGEVAQKCSERIEKYAELRKKYSDLTWLADYENELLDYLQEIDKLEAKRKW